MKKSYKDYKTVCLGGSDVASVTVTGCGKDGLKAEIIGFGADGIYDAYLVDENAEIGSHYSLETVFNTWITVYDDDGRTFHIYTKPGSEIKIYRAGDYGCIIQVEGGLEE